MRNVYTVESLAQWLETKPADELYDFLNNGSCLIAQYFKAMGIEASVGGYTYTPKGESWAKAFPLHWSNIAQEHPRTFGEALARARKIIDNRRGIDKLLGG